MQQKEFNHFNTKTIITFLAKYTKSRRYLKHLTLLVENRYTIQKNSLSTYYKREICTAVHRHVGIISL